jgi:hypothetical protein
LSDLCGSYFAAQLFIDSKTHLPLMLSWSTPPSLVPVVAGQKPPAKQADERSEGQKIKKREFS